MLPHDNDEEVAAVTEATPLSSSSSHSYPPQIIINDQQHLASKRRWWFIISTVLSILAAHFLLLSNNESFRNPSVDNDISDVPSERKDIVENNEHHEKISLTYPSPSLYLQSRSRSSSQKQKQLLHHLLGREHEEEGTSTLRWGILGPGEYFINVMYISYVSYAVCPKLDSQQLFCVHIINLKEELHTILHPHYQY